MNGSYCEILDKRLTSHLSYYFGLGGMEVGVYLVFPYSTVATQAQNAAAGTVHRGMRQERYSGSISNPYSALVCH
jgi:hypothetical protein